MTGKSREVMDGIGMIEQDPVIQTFGLGDVIGHRLNDSPPYPGKETDVAIFLIF